MPKKECDRPKTKMIHDPPEAEGYFRAVESYVEKKEYEDAKDVLLASLAQAAGDEEKREIFLWLTEICLEQGNRQEALEYWSGAVAVTQNPADDPWLHALRGRVLLDQYAAVNLDDRDGEIWEQAIESLRQGVALGPDQQILAQLYLDLGRAFSERGMTEVAADYFRKALAQQPEDKQRLAECYMGLGLLELWGNENPEEAKHLLQIALETSPLSPPSNWLAFVHWGLGWAFIMSGRPREAVKAGEKELAVADAREYDYESILSGAYHLLGAAYADIPGEEDVAIQHYLQALDRKEDSEVRRRVGDLYRDKDAFEQAFKMYEQVLRLSPDYPNLGDVYNSMGVCLGKMERHQEALAYFEKAREEQSSISFKPAELYSNIGVTHWRLNQFGEAAEAFKTALRLMRPKDKEYRKVERYLRYVQAGVSLGDDAS
jgi:tetratricopeptide (TPR) repeat protein